MHDHGQWILLAAGATLAATVTGSAAHGQAEDRPDYFYSYFKESIPLALDAGRMIVRAPAAPDAAALAASVAPLGIAPADVIPGPLHGWYTIAPPAAARTDAGIRALAAQLITADPVEFVSPVFRTPEDLAVMVTPDLLVGFEPDVAPARAEAILRAAGAGVILERDYARMPNVYRLGTAYADGRDVLAVANDLARRPDVRFAEPDFILEGRPAVDLPNDEHFFRQWAMHSTGQNIYAGAPGDAWCLQEFGVICDEVPGVTPNFDMDAPEAWAITTGDPSIKVLIFDCGIELDHPDLMLDPADSWDFTDDLCSGQNCGGWAVTDCDCHGTVVAGSVGAIMNNSIGMAGLAPGCRVGSARIAHDTCSGWIMQASWIIDGLDWAQTNNVAVTNHSYGITNSAALATKFDETRAAGLLHFAAAGNDSGSPVIFPANVDSVIAVSALNPYVAGLADFSNVGPEVLFAAPGEYIGTTDRSGDDCWMSGFGDPTWDDYIDAWGTSLASPLAAGVAALVLSVDPTLTPDEVVAIMAMSAVDLGEPGWDEQYGWGFVNAYNAVALTECLVNLPPGPDADCNGNGVEDACEIQVGLSEDANADGVPDECQAVTNDTCPGGPLVLAGTTAFTTVVAQTEGPADPGCGDQRDVWFKFFAQCEGLARIDTCGSDFPTEVAAYVACPTGGGEAIACSGDGCGDVLAFQVSPGLYRIRVGGAGGAMGNGVLNITCDACPADSDGSGTVDIVDLLALLSAWGTGDPAFDIAPDVPDGVVDIQDLLATLAAWGTCP